MVKYASSKDKALAFLIDIVFVSGMGFLIGIIASIINLFFPFLSIAFFKSYWCLICGLIIVWLYFALMDSSKTQGTIGKMALGLKVTDMKYKKVTFKTATKRFFFKAISFGLKPNGKGQSTHDRLSNCLVIKE